MKGLVATGQAKNTTGKVIDSFTFAPAACGTNPDRGGAPDVPAVDSRRGSEPSPTGPGLASPAKSGCGCATAGADAGGLLLLLLAALLLHARRRR